MGLVRCRNWLINGVESWTRSWRVLRRSWTRHDTGRNSLQHIASADPTTSYRPLGHSHEVDLHNAHLDHSCTIRSRTLFTCLAWKVKPHPRSATAFFGRTDIHASLHNLTMKRDQGAEALLTMTILPPNLSRIVPRLGRSRGTWS